MDALDPQTLTTTAIKVWAPALPEDPTTLATATLVELCEQTAAGIERCSDVDIASDVLARLLSIEHYLARKQQAGPAQTAARLLELRIGELLGEAPTGRVPNKWGHDPTFGLRHDERVDFRKMAAHRPLVVGLPPTSRRKVLEAIEQARQLDARPVDPTAYSEPDMSDVPDAAFTTIVADPPWQYDNERTRNAAVKRYQTMTLDQIVALPVDKKVHDRAHLYLWTMHSFLFAAKHILDAWGFTYKTHLVWVKPQIGMGNYFRSAHEHVLFGVRGALGTNANNVSDWFQSDRLAHSVKPDVFYDLVERSSGGPYLEMFARRRRLGWSTWGDEA